MTTDVLQLGTVPRGVLELRTMAGEVLELGTVTTGVHQLETMTTALPSYLMSLTGQEEKTLMRKLFSSPASTVEGTMA